MTSAYPLSWPEHIARTKSREAGRFKTTLAGALKNVETSLQLFGRDSGKPVASIVLSSNVTLGVDRPADPGVAVWFTWDGMQVCIPVDRYTTPAANLQAIHHVVEARRVEIRHGTLELVRATFRGFQALPTPDRPSYWEILGIEPTRNSDAIAAAYRAKARTAHPDTGGSTAAMQELTAARDAALREIGS